MKHLLLSALLLGLVPAAWAQSANPMVWCPAGATWAYSYSLFEAQGTITVRYVRDTLVAGQQAQLLTRQLAEYSRAYPTVISSRFMPSVVTRTVADRVEVLANGKFYTLYDFGGQPSTSWLTPRVVPAGPCPAEVVRVTVDSVGTQQVAGRPLRWFRAHLTTPAGTAVLGTWPGRIYEQLGNLQYMQPQSLTCAGTDPGFMGPFLTYRAASWPVIGYSSTTGILLATAQARATAAGFAAFPNPSSGLFTLQLPAASVPTAMLQLFDVTGRMVRQLPVPGNRQFDVRGLPAGSYTLLLTSPNELPLTQHLVVQ
jgi:hypothetical protein